MIFAMKKNPFSMQPFYAQLTSLVFTKFNIYDIFLDKRKQNTAIGFYFSRVSFLSSCPLSSSFLGVKSVASSPNVSCSRA